MQLGNHILWHTEDLAHKPIPEEAKLFLMQQGLPEWIPYAIEFGLYDSDGTELVIGVRGDQPILVCPDGHVEVEEARGPCFFNSSVPQLGDCISAYLTLTGADEEASAHSLEAFKRRLTEIDPQCWQTGSVWEAVLREVEKDLAML
jgi:hypothetical protein